MSGSPIDRFFAKVMSPDLDGCWPWAGSKNSNGYGKFWSGSKVIGAHRFSYEQFHGLLNAEDNVLHSCDHPYCVNPSHLFKGTHQDNMDDKVFKGRSYKPKSDSSPKSILTDLIAFAIKNSTLKGRVLAEKFNISYSEVKHIKYNHVFKHIKKLK